MKTNLTYTLLAAILLLSACDTSEPLSATEETPMVCLAPRSTDDGSTADISTYTLLAFSRNLATDATNNFAYAASGSYYRVQGETYLTPGTVTGGVGKKNDEEGILGSPGKVWLSCVTPVQSVNSTTGGTCWLVLDPANAFYYSQVEAEVLNGYGTVEIDNTMRKPLAKLDFRFYVNDGTECDVNVTPVVKGSGDGEVNFYPATRQIRLINSEATGRSLTEWTEADDSNSKTIEVDGGTATLCYSGNVIVPAAFYATKDVVREALGAQSGSTAFIDGCNNLALSFSMTQGVITRDVSLSLTRNLTELEPMHEYVFNVKVQSTYISVTADVYDHSDSKDWEKVDLTSGEPTVKDVPIATIVYNQANGSWETVDYDNPAIGTGPTA